LLNRQIFVILVGMTKHISPKEEILNTNILSMLSGRPLALAEAMLQDEEAHALQDYANVVSIKRLGFNDHGPVHMRQVVHNAIVLTQLLTQSGIKLSLETEEVGSYEDSLCAILLAAFLHDSGMTLTRSIHEQTALVVDYDIINRLLLQVYGNDPQRYVVRSLALEGILGHMATTPIHSKEAGIILVADGCDMQKGRARVPMLRSADAIEGKQGDIHKYSADAIEKVSLVPGDSHPIKIIIEMTSSIGFFQVEEVLLPKINKSPIKPYIELFGFVQGREGGKRYL
jgi:metal-dependent HD superfamily phosphatase/phosphodiesterase